MIIPPDTTGFSNVRFMKVIESEAVPTDPAGGVSNRYQYQLESIVFDPATGVVSTPTDPFTLPRACVWNLCEINNTQAVAMGVTIANLPGTFQLKPIPTGTIVPAWLSMDQDDEFTGFCMWPNQFDGDCDG